MGKNKKVKNLTPRLDSAARVRGKLKFHQYYTLDSILVLVKSVLESASISVLPIPNQ